MQTEFARIDAGIRENIDFNTATPFSLSLAHALLALTNEAAKQIHVLQQQVQALQQRLPPSP